MLDNLSPTLTSALGLEGGKMEVEKLHHWHLWLLIWFCFSFQTHPARPAPGSKFTKDSTKLEPSSPPGEISPEPHRGAVLDLAGTSQANSR